jgi:hypothetical protein
MNLDGNAKLYMEMLKDEWKIYKYALIEHFVYDHVLP